MSGILLAAEGPCGLLAAAPVAQAAERAGYTVALVSATTRDEAALEAALQLPAPEKRIVTGREQALEIARALVVVGCTLDRLQPSLVVVAGEGAASFAAARAAATKGIPIALLGARSTARGAWSAQDISGRLLRELATVLFCATERDLRGLVGAGIPESRLAHVGSTLVEGLAELDRAGAASTLHAAAHTDYVVVALGRTETLDDESALRNLHEAVLLISRLAPVVFPVDDEQRAKLAAAGLGEAENEPGLVLSPPMEFLDLVALVRSARLVLTDLESLDELATALRVPHLAIQQSTADDAVGLPASAPEWLVEETLRVLEAERGREAAPDLWDEYVGERVIERLEGMLGTRPTAEARVGIRS
jgi:UDP-N-acetylglucosamine 2-epimerase (non-hydrolysing)